MVKTNIRFLALSLLMPALACAVTPNSRDLTHLAAGVALGALQEASGTTDFAAMNANPNFLVDFVGNTMLKASGAGTLHRKLVGPHLNRFFDAASQPQLVTGRDEVARTAGQLIGSALVLHNYNIKNAPLTWTKPLSTIDPLNAYEGIIWTAKNLPNFIQAEATVAQNTTVVPATPGAAHVYEASVGVAVVTPKKK